MFTHTEIWIGIDRLAEKSGYSPSGLAKKAGLDATSFNKSKRVSPDGKPRWPSTESISKVLSVTGKTMSDLILYIEEHKSDGPTGLTREDIAAHAAQILIETKSVLFNAKDPFTLKSGKQSPVYVDCRRLISFVEERESLMRYGATILSQEINMSDVDCVAGGETAGIPYGAFIADELRKPMIYVRKEPKGYGRLAQIEGVLGEDRPHVILIEDLQTDGGSKKVFIDALRSAGARVEHAFVVFHYGIFPQSEQNMKDMGITLHALCTWWDVLKIARQKNYFDADTLNSVERFLNAPNDWST